MTDGFGLQRFLATPAGTFEDVLAEISAGAKSGHWMWFVFPQIAGLGSSTMARHYAIRSLDEARAYLAHPVLGSRLRACLAALEGLAVTTPEAVFGQIDAMKLRSCLTLFLAAGGGSAFRAAIERWFHGQEDAATLALLADPSALNAEQSSR
ncbi:uncharacterized protein (DUF1810 family) [Novosphingobium sp. SG751A]|uniref:DUF1810 domain-containing protein n=1 Tax=Novosphingobium sp. SG751A TaxID=2587000 RepID=UPI0015575E60|nr:DUF1810 domain-containing protein [Novosphingobium sp. SG751A]NOW48968.1 uncharacterized protein (DUF1810 family) [Novosphingobium sp. SG751A]